MSYLKKFSLKKKFAIVLGGSGLIGRETSLALDSCGAKVLVLDKDKPNFKNKKNIFYEKIDISNLSKTEKVLNRVKRKYQAPDIFINCSYPKTKDWSHNSFENIKLKSYKKNIDIHLNSFSWIAKIIADQMKKKKKGSIIRLSSIYGLVAQDLNIYKGTNMRESMTYSVIKGGINILVKQMASYYGSYGIRVNSLCAGGVFDNQNKKFVKRYNEKVPLKRMAEPSDIASSLVFLSSEASSYITGANFAVDGGWTVI